jgi:hypothetical protein
MDGLPATQLPQARVCHLAHGRLRLKIPEKRRDEAFFDTVRKQLSGQNGIERVEVNPLTASVLVQFHDPDAPVAENALKNDLFKVDVDALEAVVEPPALTEEAAEVFAQADMTVRQWTGNAADLRSAIFLALIVGGLYQLLRGNIAAPAATLLWYAGATLRLWDVAPAPNGSAAGSCDAMAGD